jgi:hypothetical protein
VNEAVGTVATEQFRSDRRKSTMMKSLIAAGVLGLALSAPASAAEMATCDDASMMKMDEVIKADTDPKMKDAADMAMKELDMAKMAMKDGKTDDCAMHLTNAMKSMEMKPSN